MPTYGELMRIVIFRLSYWKHKATVINTPKRHGRISMLPTGSLANDKLDGIERFVELAVINIRNKKRNLSVGNAMITFVEGP